MIQQSLIHEVKPAISFEIAGDPLTQGSKVAMISGKRHKDRRGNVWIRNPIASLIEQSNRSTKTRKKDALKLWRSRIAYAGAQRMDKQPLWLGPILLECEFVIARSPSHYTGTGKLTKSAPMVPPRDLDKMLRAVGDSLSKVVYNDDVQITGFGGSTKRYSENIKSIGGVRIKVSQR